jgi:hypothetical protein
MLKDNDNSEMGDLSTGKSLKRGNEIVHGVR